MGFTMKNIEVAWCHVILSIAGVGTQRSVLQMDHMGHIWACLKKTGGPKLAPKNVLGKTQFIATSHLIREYGYNSSAHHSLATGDHILLTIHMKSSL